MAVHPSGSYSVIGGGGPRPYAKDVNRLISSLVPTGKVFCQDDFEAATLKWQNTGGTTARDTTAYMPFMGTACLEVTSPATINDQNITRRRFSLPRNKTLGLEFRFLITDLTLMKIIIALDMYDGSQVKTAEFQYLPADEKWQYAGVPFGWDDLPGGSQPVWNVEAHQHIKFVADFDNLRYSYLCIGGNVIDMSSLAFDSRSNTSDPYLSLQFTVRTYENVAKSMFIDDLILTSEEVMIA